MKPTPILILLFALALSISVSATETTIFSDNFNDGTITDWDNNAGVWSAATFRLIGGALDGSVLSHSVAMPAGNSYRFYYQNNPNFAGLNNEFFWFTDQNGRANFSGYNLVVQSATLLVRRYVNGTPTTILSSGGVTTGTMHDINISHTFDGNIQVWVDGTSRGSVIDNVFNKGSKIMYGTSGDVTDGNWDNLFVINTGDTNNIFRVVNELTPAVFLQATMTINGMPWPVGVDGNFDVNAGITFPATIVISKTGYSTRTFTFDTNAGLYFNKRFGLRDSTQTSDIDFQFFKPDETTELATRFIRVMRNGVLSGAAKTNPSGLVSFTLAPQDSVYDFNIFVSGSEAGDTNLEYSYGSVSVTVNQPKDEATNTNIAGGFDIDIGGLGLQNYSNQSVFPLSSIFILGNTLDVYTMRIVDNNASGQLYFPRLYVMEAKGDINNVTINPYLITLADGIPVNLIVKNISDERTLPNIRLQMKTGLGGSLVTVEDQLTNATGASPFTFISKREYQIAVTNQNQDTNYFSGIFTSTNSSFTIWINYNTTTYGGNQHDVNVTWVPLSPFISGKSQLVRATVNANFPISYLQIYGLDSNVITDRNNTSSTFIIDLNLQLYNYDNNQVLVRLDIVPTIGQNVSVFQNYIISAKPVDVIESFRKLKQSLTPISLFVIVMVILLAGISLLGNSIFGSNESQVFFIGLLGCLLFFIFFFEEVYIKVLLAAIVLGAAAWFWTRSNK